VNERHPEDDTALQVDQVCLRFEKAWQALEDRPRLEEYLAGVTASARVEALRELLALELIYRQRLGDTFALDGYEQRFPADLPVIHSVFSAVVVTMPGAAVNGGPAASPGKSDVFIPGYEVLGELGRGGMGIVYMARQVKPNRIVALKKIKTGADAAAAELTRFRTEAEAVARLQHPNIVQIFEVGEHNGLPFFSLEFCGGGSLKAKLAGTPLPAAEAARLVATLARAVQAAHDQKVIHRDLNPANVLLAEDGTPKITDFGLAKKLDDVGGTVTGAVMGTPSYMAPEQARGQTQEIGPAADVYALGAILYECLTGHPPFKAATAHETLVQVVADDPVPPRQLQPKTPRDLETICLKCLHKEPGRRYASALDLAEDLQRFAAGEPIRARPVGRGERVLKWARRRPAVAALLGLVVLLTAAGLGGIAWEYGEALRERNNAQTEATNARLAEKKTQEQLTETAKAEKKAQERLEQTKRALANSQGLLADTAWREGHVAVAQNRLEEVPTELRRWEWHYLKRTTAGGLFTLFGHTDSVTSVCFSPDGQRLATASKDSTAKVWDARTGQQVLALQGHTNTVSSVSFSPDGQRLATGSHDTTAKVWDARTGQELLTLKGHTRPVTSVSFSPDGQRLATGSHDPAAKVWDVRTGQPLLALQGHTNIVSSVCFSPDGRRLVSTEKGGKSLVWDSRTGQRLDEQPPPLALSSARSPDGRLFAWIAGSVVRLLGPPDAEELLVRRARTRLDPHWHAEGAARMETEEQWAAVAFHAEQFLAARPRVLAANRDLVRALTETTHQQPELSSAWRRLALAQLHTGQEDAFRRTCRQMQQRFRVPGQFPQAVFAFGSMPSNPAGAAVTTALLRHPAAAPGPSLFDRFQTVRASVLRPGVLVDPESWLRQIPEDEKLLRGAILCRAGKHADAVKELQSLKEPLACLFRALAEHDRGNKDAARQALAEALKQLPPEKIDLIQQTPLPWQQRVEIDVLRREVEALLGPARE
jgi:hypothetical protein